METQLDQIRFVSAGHSATVAMSLHIGATTLSILQAGKNAIKLSESHDVPNGDADVEIVIDGRPRHWPVRVLPGGPRAGWRFIEDR